MRKKRPVADRFWPKVDRRGPDECWPWLAGVRRKDEGYGAFYVNGRHKPASRVAYELTFGEVAKGLVICHRCDNPGCCNPAHLFVGTNQDNDADRVAKGRQARGSRNAASKLTERQVWAIRKLRAIGVKPGRLAWMFGITPAYVWELCNLPIWTHIDNAAMARLVREDWENHRRSKGA